MNHPRATSSCSRSVGLSKQPSQPKRRAAILICVLVVLLIVGAMGAQTIQTLLIVRQADRARSNFRQAQELVELGRLTLAQGRFPDDGQIDLTVDGVPAIIKLTQLAVPPPSPETQEADQASQARYRILAIYAYGSAKEVTATWETPK